METARLNAVRWNASDSSICSKQSTIAKTMKNQKWRRRIEYILMAICHEDIMVFKALGKFVVTIMFICIGELMRSGFLMYLSLSRVSSEYCNSRTLSGHFRTYPLLLIKGVCSLGLSECQISRRRYFVYRLPAVPVPQIYATFLSLTLVWTTLL